MKYKELKENIQKFNYTPHIGYFSIGKKLNIPLTQVNEWVYDHGFNKDEYERFREKNDYAPYAKPINYDPNINTNQSVAPGDLEYELNNYYHKYNAVEKQEHFSRYTMDGGSSGINKFLISHHNGTASPKDHLYNSHDVQHIDDMMKKYSFKAPKSFFVYTGVGDSLNIDEHRTNRSNRLYLPAYTSTSLDPTEAEDFTTQKLHDNPDQDTTKKYREIVRLHIPQNSTYGTHLGNAGFGEHGDGDGDEKEFLLHRGLHIQFLGQPRIYPGITAQNSKVLVHDAKIIRQTIKPI